MQISSRFTIAIHIFSCINTFGGEQKITSDFLATSIQVNPVIIRKLLGHIESNTEITTRYIIENGTGKGWAEIAFPDNKGVGFVIA